MRVAWPLFLLLSTVADSFAAPKARVTSRTLLSVKEALPYLFSQ
jgi:hypothetical protein